MKYIFAVSQRGYPGIFIEDPLVNPKLLEGIPVHFITDSRAEIVRKGYYFQSLSDIDFKPFSGKGRIKIEAGIFLFTKNKRFLDDRESFEKEFYPNGFIIGERFIVMEERNVDKLNHKVRNFLFLDNLIDYYED